ncbi:MAG: Asp/Glu racemase [Paracoccaceae bacterium]|nr:Asp/Glu racemase [Paracoccaceae bacterium]
MSEPVRLNRYRQKRQLHFGRSKLEQTFPYELGKTVGAKANFGLIALQSDETIEHDMRRLLPGAEVGIYTSRVPSGSDVSTESLAQMETTLAGAAGLLPPPMNFDVVGYGCTSGTSVIGPDNVAKLISRGCCVRHVTEPVSALIAACRALGVFKIAFLSPYVADVSQILRLVLARNGLETAVFGSFNEGTEAKVARIAKQSIKAAALALVKGSHADAIFLSCTNLQTLNVIEEIEAECNLPVLSSNQVLAWHMSVLAKQTDFSERVGKLMV